MSNINGVTLNNYLTKSSEFINLNTQNKYNNIIDILKNIAQILEIYQNNCNFIHGDLNFNNIMLVNKNVYIIDFGLSFIKIEEMNNSTLFNYLHNYDFNSVFNDNNFIKSCDLFNLLPRFLSIFQSNNLSPIKNRFIRALFNKILLINSNCLDKSLLKEKTKITELRREKVNKFLAYSKRYRYNLYKSTINANKSKRLIQLIPEYQNIINKPNISNSNCNNIIYEVLEQVEKNLTPIHFIEQLKELVIIN